MGRCRRIMGVVMKEQDKRAIESMCRCGLDLEGVISVFPTFPKEDVMAIYNAVKRPVSYTHLTLPTILRV